MTFRIPKDAGNFFLTGFGTIHLCEAELCYMELANMFTCIYSYFFLKFSFCLSVEHDFSFVETRNTIYLRVFIFKSLFFFVTS